MNERYILTKLNRKFVVTDSRSSELIIVNDLGAPADNTRASDVKFFGMSQDKAENLALTLNRH